MTAILGQAEEIKHLGRTVEVDGATPPNGDQAILPKRQTESRKEVTGGAAAAWPNDRRSSPWFPVRSWRYGGIISPVFEVKKEIPVYTAESQNGNHDLLLATL
jgi:hypothetical protein